MFDKDFDWKKDNAMKRMCRERAGRTWRARRCATMELLRSARIVTDPNKLASLKAEVAKRKGRAEGDPFSAEHQPSL
jgi:hypothetical protein